MAGKMNLKRIIKLYGIYAKMDMVWLLRDTKYAIAGILADLISNISTVSGVFLIAARFGGIGGMSTDEVLFMMAYSTMITGIFITFGSANTIHISRIIGRGQLEHLFMEPLSLGVQLFTSGFAPFTGSSNLFAGLILLIITVRRLSLAVTAVWVVSLVIYLLITMMIIIARAYLVSSLAFYAQAAAEEISSTAIDGTWFLSTFPLSGMPLYIQIPLMSIMPEGLMAWFPALCLLGRPPLPFSPYYPIVFAMILSIVASCVFRKGLRYYVKKGSNRYVPYGFRR